MAAPSLDVRFTRSQSGNIIAFDLIGTTNAERNQKNNPPSKLHKTLHSKHTQPPLEQPQNDTNYALVQHHRKLKILEHKVHKVDSRLTENGKLEEELIVSNLRFFTIKVGVLNDRDQVMTDSAIGLRATLLYENGFNVKQTSLSEPLLIGETEVVALQGVAMFKLRITSLSSHRDKQRFRIQIAPQDDAITKCEPNFYVVTEPMKSVTKLGRSNISAPASSEDAGSDADLKRKMREMLSEHESELQRFEKSQRAISEKMASVRNMIDRIVQKQNG